jgi:hypothetical protein
VKHGSEKAGRLPSERRTGATIRPTKRHVLTDGYGIPIAIALTDANVHEKWMVGAMLDCGQVSSLGADL